MRESCACSLSADSHVTSRTTARDPSHDPRPSSYAHTETSLSLASAMPHLACAVACGLPKYTLQTTKSRATQQPVTTGRLANAVEVGLHLSLLLQLVQHRAPKRKRQDALWKRGDKLQAFIKHITITGSLSTSNCSHNMQIHVDAKVC